jgi:O-antigen/teichoic acid export membrane protein
MTRLPPALKDRSVLGAGLSLAVKVAGSGAAVVMFALAARGMPVADFGLLVIVFNIVSFLAVFAVLGQETLILRTWGEFSEREPALARGAVLWGIGIAALGAAVAALGFTTWADFVDGRLDGFDVAAAALFVVTQTALLFSSSLTRAVRGIRWSEPHRELTWRLPLVLVLALALVAGRETSIGEFFAVAVAGQIAALVFQAVAVGRGLPEAVRHVQPIWRPAEWGRLGATMTSAAMVEAANQYADVVLIGMLAGPAVSAGWFVAIRIANVFGMLTSGLHNYTASRVASLYWTDRRDELQALLVRVMSLALVLVAAVLGLVVFGGSWFLSLFGEAYREQYPLLLVLAGVTAFATLAGPGPLLMLTTGREGLYLKLIAAAFVLRVTLLVVLVPIWGLWGAAAAMVAAVVPPAIAITVLCIRRIGVDPSIGAVLRRLLSRRVITR